MAVSGISGASIGYPGASVQPHAPAVESKERQNTSTTNTMDKGPSPLATRAENHPNEEPGASVRGENSQKHALGTERAGTKLHMDDATERIVAEILGQDREVIRQIPPEEQLKIIAKTREVAGILFDQLA